MNVYRRLNNGMIESQNISEYFIQISISPFFWHCFGLGFLWLPSQTLKALLAALDPLP